MSGGPPFRPLAQLHLRRAHHSDLTPTQDWLDQENTDLIKAERRFWEGLDAVAAYDLGGQLGKISCPTLFLWGQEFLYAAQRNEFIRHIRTHKVVLIPQAGLLLQLDNPIAHRTAAMEFVDSLGLCVR